MSSILPCSDLRDAVLLSEAQGLYLKPLASVWISVQLPAELKRTTGKSVSTWEIMEKIKSAACPDEIVGIKVLKSTLEVVRFEAHLESRHQIRAVLDRLDRSTLKLNSFADPLKMRACESKLVYPSRHDWDTFFHENKNMNELKPGERADTVHLRMLPCHWFMASQLNGTEVNKKMRPSESVVRSVFEMFGPLRTVDIPMLDPYREKIVPNSNTFAFGQDGLFEAYIQFQEYVGFVKCMSAFRGMKLLYRKGNAAWTALIQVDFDRTRHQSEISIRNRRIARERIIQEELNQERAEKTRRELELQLLKEEEIRRQRQVEEEIAKKKAEEEAAMKIKEEEARVVLEERKLVLVQRRLESLRLLDAILDRVKDQVEKKQEHAQKKPKKKDKSKKSKEEKKQRKLEEKERALRAKLVKKYQQVGEKMLEEQRERVRQTLQASAVKLKSSISVVVPSQASSSSLTTSQSSQRDLQQNSTSANGVNIISPSSSRPPKNKEVCQSKPHHERQSTGHVPRSSDHHHPYGGGKTYESESFHHRRSSSAYEGKRNRFHSEQHEDQLDQELWNGPDLSSSGRGQRENFRGRGQYRHYHHHHGPYPRRDHRFNRFRPHDNMM